MLKHTIPAALEKHGPLTNEGLRRVCPGASRSGVHRLLQELKNSGKIYISGYMLSKGKIGGVHTPIYALGDLPDAANNLATRRDTQAHRKTEPEPPARIAVRQVRVRPLVPPKARQPMRINRAQTAGMWSGLMT